MGNKNKVWFQSYYLFDYFFFYLSQLQFFNLESFHEFLQFYALKQR